MKLAPNAFWSLSLAEWRALTRPHRAPQLDRTAFEAMAQRYPD